MGQAIIMKQPGGRYKAQNRFRSNEKWYRRKSGDSILKELVRLLRKQQMKFRVLELDDKWKVLWT